LGRIAKKKYIYTHTYIHCRFKTIRQFFKKNFENLAKVTLCSIDIPGTKQNINLKPLA